MVENAAMATNDVQVTIRIPTEAIDRADELVAALGKQPEFRYLRVTRTGLLRQALLEGLDRMYERTVEGKG